MPSYSQLRDGKRAGSAAETPTRGETEDSGPLTRLAGRRFHDPRRTGRAFGIYHTHKAHSAVPASARDKLDGAIRPPHDAHDHEGQHHYLRP